MTIKILYKYQRPDGGYNVSPIQPEGEYDLRYRLIADEGKKVTSDGEKTYYCIDTDTTLGWYEIDDTSSPLEEDVI